MFKNFENTFNQYFSIIPANTAQLKTEVYKLRYQIYCLETGFEDPALYPDQIEKDAYDDHSIHYLIHHKRLNRYVATSRLILPDPVHSHRPFPVELNSQINRPELLTPIPRAKLGEISRFCVSKHFKNRKHESCSLAGISASNQNVFGAEEKRSYPHITHALIASLLKACVEHDIQYSIAIMEPALIRFLSSLGIRFTAIGPLIDYHGRRQPCILKISELL